MKRFTHQAFKTRTKWWSVLTIGVGLLVIGIGIKIWSTQVTWTKAKSSSIFNKSSDTRYFGRGSGGNADTVLPEIYDYTEHRGGHTRKYAVNMTEFTGLGQEALWSIRPQDGSYVEIKDVKSFFDRIESKARGIRGDRKNYEAYKNKRQTINANPGIQLYVTPIEACVEKRSGGVGVLASERSYNDNWQPCRDWLVNGYEFVMYSAAGVPQTRSSDRTFFEQQYQAIKNDPNKKLTVQWMSGGGDFQYYQGSGKTGSASREMQIHNTAINAEKNDVVRSTYGIGSSIAIILWDKNSESSSNPAEPLWVLRLVCANPIAAAIKERKADLSVRVTASPNPVYLPPGGEATVKFKYEVGKNVNGYAKHMMHYVFSSEPQKSINPDLTKVTYSSNPQAKKVGSVLAKNKSIDIPTDFPQLSLTYEEDVVINHHNKGTVWQMIDATQGRICRNLGGKPKAKEHSFPPELVTALNKNSKACVTIRFGGITPEAGPGGVYVDPLIPNIAPIGTPIGQDINGINSWVVRPKQWTPKDAPAYASYNSCRKDTWYRPQGYEKLHQDCQRRCQTRVADRWVWRMESYELSKYWSRHRREGEWYPCNQKNSSSDHKFECKTDFLRGSYDREEREWWYQGEDYRREFRKIPHYEGMNEDRIECHLEDVKYTDTTCWDCRCSTGYYNAKCVWKKRTPEVKWEITKMIYKPEHMSPSYQDRKPMNLISSDDPTKHFCEDNNLPNGSYTCQKVASGTDNLDDIDKFYPISKPKANGQPPHKPYDNMHINVSPREGGRWHKVGVGTPGLTDLKYEIEELPSGTTVCFALSVFPWKNNGKDPKRWAHSKPECLTVSKKPYFAVENGMLVSGGNIVTNLTTTPDKKRYGSWVEYNAAAQGSLMNALATNTPNSEGRILTPDKWHRLTFANTTDPKGRFGGNIGEDVIDALQFFDSLPGVRGDYANTTYERHTKSEIDGHSKGIHIYDGNVTITKNINGNDQMVIVVKGNLTIKHNVSNIDAWLIVGGELMTSDKQLTKDELAKGEIVQNEVPLVVNGPVRAQSIKLRRTAGSGIKSPINSLKPATKQFDRPAETFRLTPQTYIWSYYNSLDKGKVQTVYLREVAPRY